MTIKQTVWLLRLGVPFAGLIVALLCGRSVIGAVGMLGLTALVVAFSLIDPFGFIGILFAPLASIYSRKAEAELRDPDTQLFLFLGIPATLATVGLLSIFTKS